MTKQDIADFIDRLGAGIPERISGNEENAIIAARLENIALNERDTLVELLREWISMRIIKSGETKDYGKKTGQLFLALEVACLYDLNELRPDIELLIKDAREGKTYLPYYAEMITNYLDKLGNKPGVKMTD
ncbi:MAG: hypothetical protein ACRESW_06115 [Nevskiales bacterium]